MLVKLDKWHHTKPGLVVFAVVELVIAYGFASLAIDRGTWWWYLLTLIFLVGSLQNFFKLAGSYKRGTTDRK